MARIPDVMEILGMQRRGFDPTELRAFLGGAGSNSRELNLGPYEAYLRRSVPRFMRAGVELKRPVDLARVGRKDLKASDESAFEFRPEKLRHSRGKFQELMTLLESEAEKAGYDSVYVENIMNKFLPDVLKRYGYEQDPFTPPDLPSMFRRLGGVRSGEAFRGRGG